MRALIQLEQEGGLNFMTSRKIKIFEQIVQITIDSITLEGALTIPDQARGIILFAHGSGSSRFSPRNILVAKELQEAGLATLLIDLLTEDEDEIYENRFDIDLITQRLIDVTSWIQKQPDTKRLKIGYFGASTGAAAALKASAKLGPKICAVVSRGGRPDLANEVLSQVKAPTLLIVGGDDLEVIELNKEAYEKLKCVKEFEIIPGATHLFEEPGKLEWVAKYAADWFDKYLVEESNWR